MLVKTNEHDIQMYMNIMYKLTLWTTVMPQYDKL